MDEFLTLKTNIYKLLQWALCLTSKGSIFLEGYLNNSDLLWRSSCIKSRLSARQVCTSSGSVYELIGAIDSEASLNHGISSELIDAFRNGFPVNWEDYLSDNLSLSNSDTTNMTLQTSRFDVSTFLTTRSGRVVIPRLASWRGERLIWQTNGNFYISTGFLEAIAEKSVNSFKTERKQKSRIKHVVPDAPEARCRSKSRSRQKAVGHIDHSVLANVQPNCTRNKASISKEVVSSKVTQKKNRNAILSKPNASKHESSKTTVQLPTRRSGRYKRSNAQGRSSSTKDVDVNNNHSGQLTSTVVSLDRTRPQIRLPHSKTSSDNDRKPFLRSQRLLINSNEKKRALEERNLNMPDVVHTSSSRHKKRELEKLPSKIESMSAKSTKRKSLPMDDEPHPKYARRSNSHFRENRPVKPVGATLDKMSLTQQNSTNHGKIISGKSASSQEAPMSGSKENTNTKKSRIRKKKSPSQQKPPKPVSIQGKSTNKAKTVEKKPAVHKPALTSASSKPDRSGNAARSNDDSCLTVTPSSRTIKGSCKEPTHETSYKMPRPGTLRYEEGIRRFIREHNQDDSDDDFLATTPFRGQVSTVLVSESFLRKVDKDNDDQDIASMLTPKSMGGFPSPFTPKKTPDIGGGIYGQLIQPINQKDADHLVYRINKKKKRKPESFPQSSTQAKHNVTTPMLPKAADNLGDYVLEALSDCDSEEDKDYYFSDDE